MLVRLPMFGALPRYVMFCPMWKVRICTVLLLTLSVTDRSFTIQLLDTLSLEFLRGWVIGDDLSTVCSANLFELVLIMLINHDLKEPCYMELKQV